MSIPRIIEALYKNSILITHYANIEDCKISASEFNEHCKERTRLFKELKRYMDK